MSRCRVEVVILKVQVYASGERDFRDLELPNSNLIQTEGWEKMNTYVFFHPL